MGNNGWGTRCVSVPSQGSYLSCDTVEGPVDPNFNCGVKKEGECYWTESLNNCYCGGQIIGTCGVPTIQTIACWN